MAPTKSQRSKGVATIPVPLKFFLALVPLLLGAGVAGNNLPRTGGAPAGGGTPAAVERPAAAAGADPLAVQILQQLDTLNQRAERIEGKVDDNQKELEMRIRRLQGDVEGLKAAAQR